MTKKQVEQFLIQRRGYLKKSPVETAKVLWKLSSGKKSPAELKNDLRLIAATQQDLRRAKSIEQQEQDDNLVKIYEELLEESVKKKRIIFFDLEVSPNVVLSWRIGRKVSLSMDDIIKERAIMCVCWKFEGNDTVYSLQWKDGDDKELLEKFAKIADNCDILCGHNGDNFDIKWLRTRCLYHGIQLSPKFHTIDTLKAAKSGFLFNSNKLDYIGQFLKLGRKIPTQYEMWKKILLLNDKKTLDAMVTYCKGDVLLLEKVYNKMKSYMPLKKYKFV